MALIRRTADQIKAMLATMTFSQRMLILALLVIIAGSVFWMMNFASRPDLVPVFEQQFEPAVQARLAATLKAAGITAQTRDGKVVVSPNDRERALPILAFNDALPADFSFGFEQVVKDSNIWRSEAEKERMWKVAVENELANVLRRFPGVADAKVIVDRPDRGAFGRAADAAGSAAVHLRMKAGAAIDKKLVTAVADWVSGAVRNLPRERVKLVDSTNGRSYRVPSEDAGVPADLLELTKQYEEHFTAGILKAVGHIENVLVSVSVKVDPTTRTEKAVAVDKDKSLSLPSEEANTKGTSSDAGSGGEPGVATNTGVAVTAGPVAGGPKRSDSEDKTLYENRFGTRETVTAEQAGSIKEVSAAVNIPRSYFLAAYKAETGKDQPDAAGLKDFMTSEIGKIKPKVMAAVGLTDKAADDRVAIGWYYDAPVAATVATPDQPKGSTIGTLVLDNARGLGLGGLAVVSLVTMLLMMRKAAASTGTLAPAEPAAGGPRGPAMAFPSDGVVGEAGVADGYLQGMEVDEETLRTQKMVEQVATMVKDNPDAAANLVRRWIAKKPK